MEEEKEIIQDEHNEKESHHKKDDHHKLKREIDLLREENKLCEAKNRDTEDKFLRFQAEFQNYKRRKDEETLLFKKYANEEVIKELLPIIDNFERAINMANKDNDDLIKYIDGMKMIYSSLRNTLNMFGVKEIDLLDKHYDSNLAEAVMTDNVEGIEDGIVLEVLQKGYILNDKVIRPAMVKVNKK